MGLWGLWKKRARAVKRQKLSFYGDFKFSSNVKQSTVRFFNRGAVKRASLEPISRCKKCWVLQFVEPLVCVHLFSTIRLDDVNFADETFQLCRHVLGEQNVASILHGICFVTLKKSKSSILFIFQNEPESKFHFCWKIVSTAR